MSEWREYKISDLGKVLTGKTPPSSCPEHYGGNLPFVTPTDFKSYNKNIYSAIRCLSDSGVEANRKRILPRDSVLVTCIGSDMGKVAVNRVDCLSNQQINAIVPKRDIVNSDFLYYTLVSKYELLKGMATGGSTMPIVNKTDFENIVLSLPDLNEQQEIAEILSSLDDKIELNNRMNKNLEELAQALFRQWFVEFEFPNENGEPYRSSGGEMVESELGLIPKGWSVGDVNSIVSHLKKTVNPSLATEETFAHYSIPAFDEGQQPSMEVGSLIKSSKFQVEPGCILVSKLNPRFPRIWPILSAPSNSICSTEFQVFKPKEDGYYSFIYCFFRSYIFTDSLISKASGTSGSHQRVKPSDILSVAFPLAPSYLLRSFNEAIFCAFEQIDINRLESTNLGGVRDTLLPGLMSGELSISEVEEQVIAH